jgi:hypothetical protein
MTNTRAATVSDHFRTLTNPRARLPLPAALATPVNYHKIDDLSAAVRYGVQSHGLRFDDVPRLTVAWPHKHPDDNHHNAADPHAEELCRALKDAFPHKSILRADAIYEERNLARSERSDMLYTLTARHVFAADAHIQAEPLPFLTDDGAHGEVFVLTDWISVQGTTLANLAGYIAHNGGHVAALALPYGSKALAQYPGISKDLAYIPAERGVPQTGQVPLLAATFQRAAAGTDYTRAECVALFERALAPHGHTLINLTEGEAHFLYAEMRDRELDFNTYVEKLGMPRPAQDDFIHNLRRSGGPR